MKSFRILTILLVALTVADMSHAQDTGERFTRFSTFTLGSGRLSDVVVAVGPVPLKQTGDAGDFIASVCYQTPGGFAAFLAGELDGPEHALGGVLLSRARVRPPCTQWPTSKSPPRLSIGGIYLGMSLKAFKDLIIQPIDWQDGWAMVNFESKRKPSPEEFARLPTDLQVAMKNGDTQDYYDVVVSVSARFFQGHLDQFRVWKSETY